MRRFVKEYEIQIDNEDEHYLDEYTWTPVQKGKHIYFINNHTTRKYLHQLILGVKDAYVIDHINQDTLDNRKENLRHTTKSTNAYNVSETKSHNTSGFNGVSYDKNRNQWIARMQTQGKYKFLGYYDNKIDAIKRIDEEDIKLFGKPRRNRRFVMGDCHGNYQALKQCLERSGFDYNEDKLICLGDVVDGFTQTYEVVEELLKVKNLILILGNHDAWFISFMRHGASPNIWIHQGGYNTIYSYNKNVNPDSFLRGSIVDDTHVDVSDTIIPVTHQEFFNNAVHYHEEDDMLFVHGGFDDNRHISEQPQSFICWDRTIIDRARNRPINQYREVFVGHTTTQYYGGESHTNPKNFNNLWMMDTGAGWNGKLSMMDIDTKEVFQSDKFNGQR